MRRLVDPAAGAEAKELLQPVDSRTPDRVRWHLARLWARLHAFATTRLQQVTVTLVLIRIVAFGCLHRISCACRPPWHQWAAAAGAGSAGGRRLAAVLGAWAAGDPPCLEVSRCGCVRWYRTVWCAHPACVFVAGLVITLLPLTIVLHLAYQ